MSNSLTANGSTDPDTAVEYTKQGRFPGVPTRIFLRNIMGATRQAILIAMIPSASFLLAACSVEPANQGFCGIIPARLEGALSYGTSLYLGKMPDEAFLAEDQRRQLRRLPPVEVREDRDAVLAVSAGRCAFSIFEESSVQDREELKGLKSAQLLYDSTTVEDSNETRAFRAYFNPAALAGDEARQLTLQYLRTLWQDDFQDKLQAYGLKPVPPGLREQVLTALPGYLAPAEPQ